MILSDQKLNFLSDSYKNLKRKRLKNAFFGENEKDQVKYGFAVTDSEQK